MTINETTNYIHSIPENVSTLVSLAEHELNAEHIDMSKFKGSILQLAKTVKNRKRKIHIILPIMRPYTVDTHSKKHLDYDTFKKKNVVIKFVKRW